MKISEHRLAELKENFEFFDDDANKKLDFDEFKKVMNVEATKAAPANKKGQKASKDYYAHWDWNGYQARPRKRSLPLESTNSSDITIMGKSQDIDLLVYF